MKNRIRSTAIKTKNHVMRHKGFYGMGALAVTAIAIQQANVSTFTKFLVEKGIDPMEYFYPEALGK